ncbi:hypothetical protein SKAU_G00203530 [Synaphobranchus kaupii]|uniref:Uncharacterized protein n=1 Tax=Synaphobranchus kaupii TaxID=118154 RepID=A0A9Q1FFZ0_SYNKA|nr:hypothetical protein SKAU_G00203530 [Synaphobranchus kaupii]
MILEQRNPQNTESLQAHYINFHSLPVVGSQPLSVPGRHGNPGDFIDTERRAGQEPGRLPPPRFARFSWLNTPDTEFPSDTSPAVITQRVRNSPSDSLWAKLNTLMTGHGWDLGHSTGKSRKTEDLLHSPKTQPLPQ